MSNGSEGIRESSKLDGATHEPDPGVESNPGEFAVVWNRKSEDERAEMLHNMRVSRDRGERCWFDDHERQIAEQRSRIAALEAVIRQMGEATDARHGSKLERLDAIAALSVAAPSTVLDQVIREAKAEAEAERDALQQRIDAALFQVTGMEELYPREMVADTLRGKTR